MARSFPPDVVLLDTDSLVHVRLGRGKANPRVVMAKSYRFPAAAFVPGVVTPQLADPASLAEGLRRLRVETGNWDKLSLLLPDSWFRINLIDLPSIPSNANEALEVVRWSLKRTLPISPEELRVRYVVLSRSATQVKVLVVSSLEATLSAIEKVFTAAGFDVILIESIGLNIWNAIAAREGETNADRLFLYLRQGEFTTAVFRGGEPLFIRSRNLSADRTLEQEIRLSANYLRDSLSVESFASCHVAGAGAADIESVLASEFDTRVHPVELRSLVEEVPAGLGGLEAELAASTGVFTG